MITLERLKEIGCISTSYQAVEFRGNDCVSVTEFQSWAKSKQARYQGTIISDDCLWVATLEKVPISIASNVYSSDGETVVLWNKNKRVLFIKELVDNKLSTIKQIIFNKQEEKKMAEIDLSGVNLDNIPGNVANMNSFNTEVEQAVVTGGSKVSELNKAFIEKMAQQDIAVADNVSIVTANQKDGRALGFITRTDKAVRLSIRTVKKKGADDKFLLAPNADEEGKRAYKEYKENNGKVPSVKYLQTENEFVIKQAKPGKIIGMIISAPVAADKDFSQIIKGEASAVNDTERGTTIKILPIEYAYMYLINAFDGTIKEDEELMGPRAAWLKVKGVAVIPKDGAQNTASAVDSIRYSMQLAGKSENRKTVLTTGNYIPVKSYVAYSQAEITSGEIEAQLNNNVKMLLKGKQDRLDKLTEKSKSLLIGDGDGVKYFSASAAERAAIDPVESFDAQGPLSSVKIAVRDAKQKKDGGYTYPFIFDTDLAKILGRPDVAPIVKKTGLSVDELKTKIDSLSTKTTKSSVRKTINSLDVETIKKAMATDKDSIKNLTKMLAGVPA